ncbi:MAG: hypothetical protein ACYTXY_17430, partial [Nostoc sp.]
MGYQRGSPEKYELQIKERKATVEAAIAFEKQASMAREQEFQRKTLENDLKRQQIAAQIALYEAQGYQLAAQKSKLEAGETRRKRGAALDLVEAGEKARRPMSLTTAVDKVGSIGSGFAPLPNSDLPLAAALRYRTPQRIDINQMPKLDLKPGENIFEVYQRHRKEMELPSASAKFPTGAIADMPPMDKTTASVSSASIQPREGVGGNQFVEALKKANQGIEQRLDALRGAIMTLANT